MQRSGVRSFALVLCRPDIKLHMVTFPLIIDTFIWLHFGCSIRDVKIIIFMKNEISCTAQETSLTKSIENPLILGVIGGPWKPPLH